MGLRRWVLVAVLGVATLAIGGYALRERRLHVLTPTKFDPEPFSARGWHSGSATRRMAMALHMTDTGELRGQSRADIVARLGPPSTEVGRQMEWYLGEQESSDSMMFNYRGYLSMLLNDDGVCVRASLSIRD